MTKRVGTSRVPSGFFGRSLFFVLSLSLSVFLIPSAGAATIPSAPQYVEAMAGLTQVAVTWDAPSSTSGEALNYTARVWTVPPPTSSPVFASCSTTGLGCVIGGLVSGTNYYVDVIAANSAGTSGPSAMKPISPGNAGSPPTNVTATSDSSGKVTVKWTPSTSLGSGQFAWYTAEAFSGPEVSAGSYVSYCTADPASATSCFIVGLKLGTKYYIQVRTVTSLGSSYPSSPRLMVTAGPLSSASPSATAGAAPSSNPAVKLPAPQQVKGVLKGKNIVITWRAAPSVTGQKVSWYTAATFYSNGKLITTCKAKAIKTVFSCAVSFGKARGSVRIQVIAFYANGSRSDSKFVVVRVPA